MFNINNKLIAKIKTIVIIIINLLIVCSLVSIKELMPSETQILMIGVVAILYEAFGVSLLVYISKEHTSCDRNSKTSLSIVSWEMIIISMILYFVIALNQII